MGWFADHWLDLLGWGGSALLVFSLLQARVLRFRTLNLLACLILVVFNALVQVWPMVGMNAVLALINTWFIVRLVRQQHDQAVYEAVEVGRDDEYLRHLLRVHGRDILRHQPDFVWDPGDEAGQAFVVLTGDETVGVVLLRAEDTAGPQGHPGRVARVLLDYVTPRFRDFSPGEFVWRRSGLLRDRGFTRVVSPPGMVGAYYDRLGFRRDGESWVLDVA